MPYKYFLPLPGLSFHSLNSVFQREEAIKFGEVQHETLLSTFPSAPCIMRFSRLPGGKQHYSQSCVSVGTTRSDPLVWFFPWPCRSLSAKYMRGVPADLQMPPSLQCSPLVPCAVTACPWTLRTISSPQGGAELHLGCLFLHMI